MRTPSCQEALQEGHQAPEREVRHYGDFSRRCACMLRSLPADAITPVAIQGVSKGSYAVSSYTSALGVAGITSPNNGCAERGMQQLGPH